MTNENIAERLIDYSHQLEAEGPNVFRARAYRRAAEIVRGLGQELADIVAQEGRAGLEALPGIGESLAFTLDELVRTGEFRTQRPIDAHVEPNRALTSLPGIGTHVAHLIEERLGVRTVEELERAAHAGRLAEIGIGPKRLRGLLDAIAGRLQNSRVPEPTQGEPSAEELLAIDAEYRRTATENRLPSIKPRDFNPEHEAWLPLWRAERDGWRYRVLYSNTALAHRLGQTRDWVVIYFEDGKRSGQRTVVTETSGDLGGQRVVRGRERECRALLAPASPADHEPAA
jgi:hypothetical protein